MNRSSRSTKRLSQRLLNLKGLYWVICLRAPEALCEPQLKCLYRALLRDSHPSASGGHNSGTEAGETGNGQARSYTLNQWTLALKYLAQVTGEVRHRPLA
jgi:hypothetical protein